MSYKIQKWSIKGSSTNIKLLIQLFDCITLKTNHFKVKSFQIFVCTAGQSQIQDVYRYSEQLLNEI